jgi:SET and MYND domain-containing protein
MADRVALIKSLRDFVFPSLGTQPYSLSLPKAAYEIIPDNLRAVLLESFLGGLCQIFSTTSHDGPYHEALDVGLTILAVYTLVYPPNYPQIGAFFKIKKSLLVGNSFR